MGGNSLYADNGDQLLSQTRWLTMAIWLSTSPRRDVNVNVFVTVIDHRCLEWNTTRYCTTDKDGHEMSLAETETRRWTHQPRWDRDETFTALETWPRRWKPRCH